MYFTYLLLLRALVRGMPLWQKYGFPSGDAGQDRLALQTVRDIAAGARCAS